jgi:hypothetical protein
MLFKFFLWTIFKSSFVLFTIVFCFVSVLSLFFLDRWRKNLVHVQMFWSWQALAETRFSINIRGLWHGVSKGGNNTTAGHRVVGHGGPWFWEFMDTFRPSNDSMPLSSIRLSLGKRSEYFFFHLYIVSKFHQFIPVYSTSILYQNWYLIFYFKKENAIFSENSIMQMSSKFTVEYL